MVEKPNHTMARKPGPLLIIQYSMGGCVSVFCNSKSTAAPTEDIDPDPDLGTPVLDKRAPGTTLLLTTHISLEDEPALCQAGGHPVPVPATTTTTRTPRGTAAAAAAAARGAAVEAPASEASPEGSIGRGGKIHRPSTT